ncbi:MAG: hypothetical protein ACHQIO_21070, partial [Nevskiales bacterium]
MIRRRLSWAILAVLLAACSAPPTGQPPTLEITPHTAPTATLGAPIYTDAGQSVEARVDDLLSRMTLAEKIGQMTQVENQGIQAADVATYYIGALLSGGGGAPSPN